MLEINCECSAEDTRKLDGGGVIEMPFNHPLFGPAKITLKKCTHKKAEVVMFDAYMDQEGILCHVKKGKELPSKWKRVSGLDLRGTISG